jgi:hypothetical protein
MNDLSADAGVQPVLDETRNAHHHSAQRALSGKIACLPEELREQLNQRLLNGESGRQAIAWLNDLPRVKEILAAQFSGVPVNDENLSNWRHSGYHRWFRHRHTKDLSKYAAEITRDSDGQFAPAAAAVASARIFDFLDSAEAAQANPNDLTKCAIAASALLKMQHDSERVKIAGQRLLQHNIALRLKRDKQQRNEVAIARRILGDARAKAIEDSSWSSAEKIEALGIHMYGELWEPRPVPMPPQKP